MTRIVQSREELEAWREAVLLSSLEERTKLALLITSYYVDESDWTAYVSQARAQEEYKLTKTTFNRYYRIAKDTPFVSVIESRPSSKARWDDDPWTDRLSLSIPGNETA